jgi:two-component system nitrate/nitrite response regulator NarL
VDIQVPEHEPPLRIIVIAADRLARAGLVSLLTTWPGFEVIARVPDSSQALEFLGTASADIVLWDLGWGSLPDVEETADQLERILATGTPCMVLVDDPADALVARAAGAGGLVSRQADFALLSAAIPAVARGLLVIDPALADVFLPGRDRPIESLPEPLTAREMEVLQLLADGLSNRAIGLRLEISEHTAKFHVTAIMAKLGAQSRTEAVVRATRLGLIYL